MANWDTSTGGYVLEASLEDIGERITIVGNSLAGIGFGFERTGAGDIGGVQAAKDNGDTFVSVNFVFMGGRNFGYVVVIYMHGASDGGPVSALLSQVLGFINSPTL